MTRFGCIVVICFVAGAGILAGAAYVWHHRVAVTSEVTSATATSTAEVDPSQLSIYTSGEYGFSFFYPSNATLHDAFSDTTTVVPWRVQATGTGTPIVQITSGSDEARIGVSNDPKEIAGCLNPRPAEVPQSVVAIASTSWHQFSFQKIGTDNERVITSYRTVHASQCFAVEILSPNAALVTSSSTTSYTIRDLIMSFTFAT